jgi:hypothetical protein
MRFLMTRRYVALQKQLNIIHRYPACSVDMASVDAACEPEPMFVRACWMSAQAAMMELRTINPKEKRASGVTAPPNQSTSPYAIRMIVRFLKMV